MRRTWAKSDLRFPSPPVQKITDAMYGVVNEGGTGGVLKTCRHRTQRKIRHRAGHRLLHARAHGQTEKIRRQRLVRAVTRRDAIPKLWSRFWFRKAASTAARPPARWCATSSRPTTTRKTRTRSTETTVEYQAHMNLATARHRRLPRSRQRREAGRQRPLSSSTATKRRQPPASRSREFCELELTEV